MRNINHLKAVHGISAMDRLEIERYQTFLMEKKTPFDDSMAVWIKAYQFGQNMDHPFLQPDFYQSLTILDYQDTFYATQYHQALQWMDDGLTQSQIILVFSQVRKLLSLYADEVKNSTFSIALNHLVDVAQAVSFNVLAVSKSVGRMKTRSANEVRRLKNSYRSIAADVPNDILQAYIEHHHWKILVFELSLGQKTSYEGFERSLLHCNLAKWLKNGGLEMIPEQERESFLEAHEKVHLLGSLAIEEFERKRSENIIELLSEMEAASEEVMEVLLNLIDNEFIKTANSDVLTGLFNRRAFDMEFEKTLAFAKRYDFWLNFVIIDIDYFKKVNDEGGHIVGDEVLKKIGRILKDVARTEDMIFRWGGDEFVMITLDKEVDGSQKLAERVRLAVENAIFLQNTENEMKLTVSCGALSYWAGLDLPAHEVFAKADKVLYEAKQAGRNSVSHFVLDVKPVIKSNKVP